MSSNVVKISQRPEEGTSPAPDEGAADRFQDALRLLLNGGAAPDALALLESGLKLLPQDAASKERASESRALLLRIAGMRENAVKADKSLASLAAAIPGVVYQRTVSPEGQIRYSYISESAYDLFGVTAERILNDPEALFQHYSPEYRKHFRQRLLDASGT